MRTSYYNKEIVTDASGDLIAVAFGYDYCCEHECGVSAFYKAFDIEGPTKKVQGVKARTIRSFNEKTLLVKSFGKDTILVWNPHLGSWYFGYDRFDDKIPDDLMAAEWSKTTDEELRWTAAWTSGPGTPEFGLRFRYDAKVINELQAAFARKDIAIWLAGRRNPFAGNGLVVAIASRVPEEADEGMIETDLDDIRLAEAAADTGIQAKIDDAVQAYLEKTGRRYGPGSPGYYDLVPGWRLNSRVLEGSRDENIRTKHPVMFFLNPTEQQKNNSGWFTVEELEQWLEGQGPVVK